MEGMDEPRRIPATDGVVVALHDLGGDGPPLLLVHATGFCGRIWEPVARHLADATHVFAPDMRGHGHSAVPAGTDLSWTAIAADLAAVVADLGVTGAVAAGHSMGGAVLLLAEAAAPGTFGALWCYEPVCFPGDAAARTDGENRLAASARRRRADFPSPAAALDNFASKPPFSALHPDALAAYITHGFAPTADGGITLRCRPADEAQLYEHGSRHGAFDRLDRVRCPVTVCAGAVDDPDQPAAWAAAIAAGLPRTAPRPRPLRPPAGPRPHRRVDPRRAPRGQEGLRCPSIPSDP